MPIADAIEPTGLSDIYADGIDRIDICGPNVRVVYFTWEGDKRVITAKIIRPRSTLSIDFVEQLRAAEARKNGPTNIFSDDARH